MRNEDNNDCIRYLMKEMDPSEELLMERAMMEDEDLLIEVESMRQTFNKLDQMPEVEPPKHVQESIMQKAAEQAKKNREKNATFKPALKYAVAATLALTVSAGGAWLFLDTDVNQPAQQQAEASVTASAPTNANSASVASSQGINQVSTGNSGAPLTRFAGSNLQEAPSIPTFNSGDVDPWIDREDILHFEDQFSEQKEQFQEFVQQSKEKLQLIESSTITDQQIKPLQLTGSGN
ncbi:MAG: hypothetical protein ACQEST_05420 [Bacteroidota bacterium]